MSKEDTMLRATVPNAVTEVPPLKQIRTVPTEMLSTLAEVWWP